MHDALKFWILVLAILFLGYCLFKPKIGGPGAHPAPTKAAYADIYGGIKSALDQYQVDNGHYPKSLQDLVKQPNYATNWHGPYFDPPRLPVDPWGRKYVYEFPGRHNTSGYDLFSTGPDRTAGTADDIVSWSN